MTTTKSNGRGLMTAAGAVTLLLLSACTAETATKEDLETVGKSSAAIRDPLSTMCDYYTECDAAGNPIGAGGGGSGAGGGIGGGAGGGLGGMGGSGDGSGGGEAGGGGISGGGGPGGVGGAGAGAGMADGADLLRCQTACDMQGPALTQFCASIPVPMVQALCFANEFTGIAACNGFCYAWFLAS